MTDRALWLWMDTETTGLIEDRPTVLEAAWMVTDDQLQQLTPLRQCLTAIGPKLRRSSRRVFWTRPRSDGAPPWPANLMDPRVRQMHRQSDLEQDWVAGEKITNVEELDRLVNEDIVAARLMTGLWRGQPHLAGSGVAQFEARLLPVLGSQITLGCHYRTADVSVASMVLGTPKITEPDPDDGLELDIQAGVDVERATTMAHRAAADVRIAYRTAQQLRQATSVARGASKANSAS